MVSELQDENLVGAQAPDGAWIQCLSLLAIAQVCLRVGHKKSWVWQEVRAGRFPPPIHCGKSARWVSSEIDAWIRERIAESRKAG
ncbi:MAG: AlpA family phage regulatory protein [Betaproteobacteria bacterium]|nr:AlpA family phage regulatory protein [Betaproteobacteria bacterium]